MIASEALRTILYSNLAIIGWIVALFFNLTQYKRKKEIPSYYMRLLQKRTSEKQNKIINVVLFVLENVVIYAVISNASVFLNTSFGEWLKTGPNYFGFVYFIPIILVVFSLAVWVDPIKEIDLLTPCFPIALIFARLGCLCFGCCNGIEWQYGIFNYNYRRFEVPLPLLEACIALGLFVFLLYWRKKAKPGTLFPTYVILYSLLRFFNEFLADTPKIIFVFFNKYQILCFIGVIVGTIELLFVLKYGERISKYFDENPYGFIKKKKSKRQRVKSK